MTEPTDNIEEVADSQVESTDVETTETAEAEDGYEYVEVSNADEYWDAFDLNAYITESSEDGSNDTDDAEASEDVTTDAAFPSDDELTDADDADNVAADDEPEEYEEDLANVDLDRPAPLSRRKAERVVKGIIEPLRDPNTPIEDVVMAMAEFHPTRTQQLAESIVQESVRAYPNEWLKSITGVDVTVEQIQEWAASGGRQPSNPAPAVGDSSEFNSTVSELNELYGDDWKNPANDHNLLDSDVAVARAMRAQLGQNEAYAALQQELERTKAQLSELKPQIDHIKTAQEAEYEQLVQNTLLSEISEYRAKVESNAIPKVLAAKELLPKDTDPPEVREAKELLQSRFQPFADYGSEFDVFLEKQFSGRESMLKAMHRVGDYLSQAAKLSADARRTSNPNEAQMLQTKAVGLKQQAMLEQDALTVWTRKAAVEFLDTPHVKPLLNLLQANADLQRRLGSSGRPEIIGQTTAIGGENTFKTAVQSAKEQGVNPFDLDISGILGGR